MNDEISIKRPRGRPSTGEAMTVAERQRKARERLAEAGIGVLNVKVSIEVLDALDDYVKFKNLTKSQVIEKLLVSQLLRKR